MLIEKYSNRPLKTEAFLKIEIEAVVRMNLTKLLSDYHVCG